MYYVYVLESQKDEGFYIGYSQDLQNRFEAHKKGSVQSTKHRRPLKLIYYKAYVKAKDAKQREMFLKSGSGHKYIKKQLSEYLET